MRKHRDQDMDDRMQIFLQTIKNERKKQERIIQQKSQIQIAEARQRIMNQHVESSKQNHIKRLKGLQVEARIYKSSKINQARMSKMNVRHELIQNLKHSLREGLKNVINNERLYSALLKKLIIQGLIKLMQKQVEVKCLRRDFAIVKSIIAEAQKQFNEISEQQTTIKIISKITLNQKQFLDEEYKDPLGGIVLSSLRGRIVCINTMDARLNYCLEDMLPSIRHNLFDDSYRKS